MLVTPVTRKPILNWKTHSKGTYELVYELGNARDQKQICFDQ